MWASSIRVCFRLGCNLCYELISNQHHLDMWLQPTLPQPFPESFSRVFGSRLARRKSTLPLSPEQLVKRHRRAWYKGRDGFDGNVSCEAHSLEYLRTVDIEIVAVTVILYNNQLMTNQKETKVGW